MSKSFEQDEEVQATANRHAKPGSLAASGEPIAAGSVATLTGDDYESLASRSRLGVGLANITSRLMQQLATGGERVPSRRVADARPVQRDTRGSRVPWDRSPLVMWKRVVTVSSEGDMLALVSQPNPSDLLPSDLRGGRGS
jgi:hypothetical protein